MKNYKQTNKWNLKRGECLKAIEAQWNRWWKYIVGCGGVVSSKNEDRMEIDEEVNN